MKISTLTAAGHMQAPVRVDTHLRAGIVTRDPWCGQELTPWSPKGGSRDVCVCVGGMQETWERGAGTVAI